ncbi:MAG: helix-turn-helix domain-containing protein [Rhodospirillaceae bacterium]
MPGMPRGKTVNGLEPGEIHPIDKHVGRRIRLRRNIVGMSQQALAKGVGVTFQQVQKYERGSNRVSASRLYEIGKVLGVSVEFFYEDFQDHEELPRKGLDAAAGALLEDEDQDPTKTSDFLEFYLLYRRMGSDQIRQRLKELMKAMSNSTDERFGLTTDEVEALD